MRHDDGVARRQSGAGGVPAGEELRTQRREALGRANAIRSARANLKLELRSGARSLGEVLDDPPVWLLTAPVHGLLLAIPRIGDFRARRLLTGARIGPTERVVDLGERQRGELIASLEAFHPRAGMAARPARPGQSQVMAGGLAAHRPAQRSGSDPAVERSR
jgi:hypothetical protein